MTLANRSLRQALFVVLGFCLAGSGVAQAQPSSHRADPDARFQRLSEALALDPSQAPAVREAMDARRAEGRVIRDALRAGEISREDARARHEALRAQQRETLAGVLTPEQLTDLDALGEQRRTHQRTRREARRERGFEHLSETLGLHESQQAQVREIMTSSFAAARELMTTEPDASREERRELMQQMRDDTRERLAGVLTPAQLDQLDALHAQRRARHGRRAPDA